LGVFAVFQGVVLSAVMQLKQTAHPEYRQYLWGSAGVWEDLGPDRACAVCDSTDACGDCEQVFQFEVVGAHDSQGEASQNRMYVTLSLHGLLFCVEIIVILCGFSGYELSLTSVSDYDLNVLFSGG